MSNGADHTNLHQGAADDYIDNPTRIRIHFEGPHWAIDGVDDEGKYTEEIWTIYDGQELTYEKAVEVAPEFAAEHGWSDLPIFTVLG